MSEDFKATPTGEKQDIRCIVCGEWMVSEGFVLRPGGQTIWPRRHDRCEIKKRKQKEVRHQHADP
jgi:hypothetical protein